MIFLTLRIEIPKVHESEFIQTVSSIGKLVRMQSGCINYQINQNLEQNNVILLQSEWEDAISMKIHLESSKFAIVMGAIRTLDLVPEIKVGKLTTLHQNQLYSGLK